MQALAQFWKTCHAAFSKRVLLTILICLAAVVAVNILVLSIYFSRSTRSREANSAVASTQTTVFKPKKTSAPPVPLASGATVQRGELSPSGNIRVKYTWSKGNPLHQIVLESLNHPGESKVFLEYQRNAWILISPDDQWIVLNNRPSAGHSEVLLYQHQGSSALDYAIPEEMQGTDDARLDQVVWKYYLEELQVGNDTLRDGVAIDAVGWDADSKKLAVTVTATPADADDNVLPPWRCVIDVATKEIDVTPEAVAAFNGQESQMSVIATQGETVAGQQIVSANAANSNKPPEGDFSGEKYQETRTRLLTADEISHWSLTNIRYAIEEIYARRGADFSDKPTVRKEFSKFAWYKPRTGTSTAQIDNELSDVEKQNVQTLEKSRDARQAAAPKSKPSRPSNPGDDIKRALGKIFSR